MTDSFPDSTRLVTCQGVGRHQRPAAAAGSMTGERAARSSNTANSQCDGGVALPDRAQPLVGRPAEGGTISAIHAAPRKTVAAAWEDRNWPRDRPGGRTVCGRLLLGDGRGRRPTDGGPLNPEDGLPGRPQGQEHVAPRQGTAALRPPRLPTAPQQGQPLARRWAPV